VILDTNLFKRDVRECAQDIDYLSQALKAGFSAFFSQMKITAIGSGEVVE